MKSLKKEDLANYNLQKEKSGKDNSVKDTSEKKRFLNRNNLKNVNSEKEKAGKGQFWKGKTEKGLN